MRAALIDPAAGALRVDDVDDPAPGPGELVVRVRAAGLNRADLITMAAAFASGRGPGGGGGPYVAGAEFAGEVIAVGEAAGSWRPGDRVMGLGPGFAELVVIDHDAAMAAPEGLSWEEAGGLPAALLTMHDALVTNGRLAPGDSVLVHAATSGVGTVGVALAAGLGASVVLATSRSAAKLATLAAFLGPLPCPVVAVDTTASDFVAEARRHTGDRGADLIVDSVGGGILAANVDAAALKGRIVQVGRLGGRRGELDLDELARKRVSLIGVTFRTRTTAERKEVVRRCVDHVGPTTARYRPRVDAVYPLADAAAALDGLGRDAHVGKIVLVP
jgi:NADPH2:quinone reductase